MKQRILYGILVALVLLLPAAFMTWSVLSQTTVSCEVCIEFHGRVQCRSASGLTREEAVRTATDNACAFLASGMTQVISCARTPPRSVSCSGDGER